MLAGRGQLAEQSSRSNSTARGRLTPGQDSELDSCPQAGAAVSFARWGRGRLAGGGRGGGPSGGWSGVLVPWAGWPLWRRAALGVSPIAAALGRSRLRSWFEPARTTDTFLD